MRLVSLERGDGRVSYGTTDGVTLRDAGAALGDRWPDLVAVLAAGAVDTLDGAGAAVPLASVRLVPPVPRPCRILCIGLNYLPHILETGRPRPEKPAIFTRDPASVVGHGAPLVRPQASTKFDSEGELAVIIGKPGRHIAPADA